MEPLPLTMEMIQTLKRMRDVPPGPAKVAIWNEYEAQQEAARLAREAIDVEAELNASRAAASEAEGRADYLEAENRRLRARLTHQPEGRPRTSKEGSK